MPVIKLNKQPCISAVSSVAGRREFEGRLGSLLDLHSDDDMFGKKSFEAAEAEMQRMSFSLALHKANLKESDIGAVFAGDLMNQCTASSYGLLQYNVPYFGLYGACSTMAEALILSALCVEGGFFGRCAACVCSHNCTSERQFRYPVEYGGQRTPTAQWTVTGSGCAIVDGGSGFAYITEVMPGISVDRKIKDAGNMGAAMAPVNVNSGLLFYQKNCKSAFQHT